MLQVQSTVVFAPFFPLRISLDLNWEKELRSFDGRQDVMRAEYEKRFQRLFGVGFFVRNVSPGSVVPHCEISREVVIPSFQILALVQPLPIGNNKGSTAKVNYIEVPPMSNNSKEFLRLTPNEIRSYCETFLEQHQRTLMPSSPPPVPRLEEHTSPSGTSPSPQNTRKEEVETANQQTQERIRDLERALIEHPERLSDSERTMMEQQLDQLKTLPDRRKRLADLRQNMEQRGIAFGSGEPP